MNNEVITYTIAVIGFEKSERHALRGVIDNSEYHQPAFRAFDKDDGGCPHLIMVDADQPSAIQVWNRFRRANAHRACFSPIFVSDKPAALPCPDPYVLQRPILPTSLLALLDKAVAEVHGYRPSRASEPACAGAVGTEVDMDAGVESVECGPGDVAALVVDGNFPLRVQMRRALAPIASRVDFAASGRRALELIDTRAYSAIFLDMALADQDAYEVCALIKKHPLQHRARVVMLTSSSSSADQVMGMLAGFDHCLVKPLKRNALSELAFELRRPVAAV